MTQLLVLYKNPTDAKVFDQHYFATHVPLAGKLPGLRSFEVSSGAVTTLQGDSPDHRVASLGFDSIDALHWALGSPEGQATAGDLSNFAHAGVELLVFDLRPV